MQCVCNKADCDNLKRYLCMWDAYISALLSPDNSINALNRMIGEQPSWDQAWPRLRAFFRRTTPPVGLYPDVSCRRLIADATTWLHQHGLIDSEQFDHVCLVWESSRVQDGLRRG